MTADEDTGRDGELAAASGRRLARLAFDLHDGPLQDVAALAADLRLLRVQAETAPVDILRGRIDDALALLASIEADLRDLAHSQESKKLLDRPLAELLRAEAEHADADGIAADVRVSGDLDACTASQRIALFRVVQEALWNVRQHSRATTVSVEVSAAAELLVAEIVDDGRGFDVDRARLEAANGARMGLAGMQERIRLLGGTLDVSSRAGGPTVVRASIPRWRPAGDSAHAAAIPRASA